MVITIGYPAQYHRASRPAPRPKASARLAVTQAVFHGVAMSFMSFPQGPRRGPKPVRTRSPVFAVGQRVCVQLADRDHLRVSLNDEAGAQVLGSLANGEQVEIVGWRPSGSHGARYQVRATDGGLQGWLAVVSLRDPRATIQAGPATQTAEVLEAASASQDTHRPFGQH